MSLLISCVINDFIMSCLLQCHDFWVSLINNFPGFLFYYLTFFTICFFPPESAWSKWYVGWLGGEFGYYYCKQNERWRSSNHPSWWLPLERKKWGLYHYIIFIFRFSFHTFLCICGQVPYTQCIQVAAAHSCYLVAELNIDSYSESARLCLIGADHLKCPRTFASPEAIQVWRYMFYLQKSCVCCME